MANGALEFVEAAGAGPIGLVIDGMDGLADEVDGAPVWLRAGDAGEASSDG